MLFAQRVRTGLVVPKAPFFEVTETHPLGFVDLQTLFDELLEIFRDSDVRFEPDGYFGHFVDQLGLSLALPRRLPMQQLVDHDTNGPYIVFDGVDVLLEGFRGHVEGTANIVLLFFGGGAM